MVRLDELHFVQRWGVAPIKSMEFHNVCFALDDRVRVYPNLNEVVATEREIIFPLYQIEYQGELVAIRGEEYFIHKDGKEAVISQFREYMEEFFFTEEELRLYLTDLGFDLYEDNGELNYFVLYEMAINEGFEYNAVLQCWLK
ncbi:hypothetical protein GLW08_10435 [Pontibacillus yanchengensis]|uniref:Uncharacterized protein n=1 Tax=Pontibacillus yanchengensis TaxID=462910 RepID=A0ACC7VFL7_9BACI|nr:hypothetical protein [Pontibacillus yanchengensis]MYL53753.1 hypothetical protein [Pontibacillus yanchengensis]